MYYLQDATLHRLKGLSVCFTYSVHDRRLCSIAYYNVSQEATLHRIKRLAVCFNYSEYDRRLRSIALSNRRNVLYMCCTLRILELYICCTLYVGTAYMLHTNNIGKYWGANSSTLHLHTNTILYLKVQKCSMLQYVLFA